MENNKESLGQILNDLDKAMKEFQDSRKARTEASRNLKATARILDAIVKSFNDIDSATEEANEACREAIRKTLQLYNQAN